jgi:hypothetical protein
VHGGARRVSATDIPAPSKDQIVDDAPPLSLLSNTPPALTNTNAPGQPVKKGKK